MPGKSKIISAFLLLLMLTSLKTKGTVWTTVSYGYWNNAWVWSSGVAPAYSTADTFIIQHPVAFNSDIDFNYGAVVMIDSAGGLCGHHNITANSGVTLTSYGVLEADSLFIPGGHVDCFPPGKVVLTLYGFLSNGGSFASNGCAVNVGQWFECEQPMYAFTLGIDEPILNPIRIFPNPNKGKFTLNNTPDCISVLIITDITGKNILRKELLPDQGNKEINISYIKNGIYFWAILCNDKSPLTGEFEICK